MSEVPSAPPEGSTLHIVKEVLDHIQQSGNLARLLKSAAHHPETSGPIAGDILYGAEAIAEYLFPGRNFRRRIYHLVETGRLPHFRLGASICSRKSVLLKWIADQEGAQGGHASQPDACLHKL